MSDEDEAKEKVVCGIAYADPKDPSCLEKVHRIVSSVSEALKERENVVMTRLNDEDLKKIDALVEIELFKSRSEAVAYFIHEGIMARKDLFEKVAPAVEKIRQLKKETRETVEKLM